MKRTVAFLISVVMILTLVPFTAAADGFAITPVDITETVVLHNELMARYLSGPIEDVTAYYNEEYEGDKSHPQPLTLSWNVSGEPDGEYTVLLSTSPDMSGAKTYTTAETSVEVTNLRISTTYYWTVSAYNGGREYTSAVSSFTTEDELPNTFEVSGVGNVRDGGGWSTMDGGRVRTGMLYRCSALGYGRNDYYINDEGIEFMHDELGIKTEIDLRDRGEAGYYEQTTSMLGEDVRYCMCDMTGIFEGESHASIVKVFEILSDPSNYPIVYHCAIGTDRTGKIAYLINAILGVSETDLERDYLMSSISDVNASRYPGDVSESYKHDIRRYHGRNLSDKAYNYVVEKIGVPAETIDKVISILKEYPQTEKGEAIYTPEDLANMRPDGNYYLASDIVTVSKTYEETFTGVLDGNGFTIVTSVPVFENFNGTVSDLKIIGTVTRNNADVGALAAGARGIRAVNVVNLADVILISDSTSDVTYAAGGIVGKTIGGENYFIDCENRGNILAYGFAGGICALANGSLTVSGTRNRGKVICRCPNAACGGLIGETLSSAFFQTSFNYGVIDSDASVTGGIAGVMTSQQDSQKTFISCGNCGELTTSGKYIGGIAGSINNANRTGSFNYCYNVGTLINTSEDAVLCGILAGTPDFSSACVRCYNAGDLVAENDPEPKKAHLIYIYNYVNEEYVYGNFCIDRSDTHAITILPEDYTNEQYLENSDGYSEAFTVEELLDGTLCEKLNEKGIAFVQKNGHPSMDAENEDTFKGIVKLYDAYREFDGKGKYIGDADIPDVSPFGDVTAEDYFNMPVMWAVWKNITAGTGENTFSPKGKCTRGQIVTMLWRAAGSPEPKNPVNPFSDVKADDYYFKAVLWAVENGITSGTGNGRFSPAMICTRAQAVTFLWVYCGSQQASVRSAFTDVPQDAYYARAVMWAVEKGVTAGTGEGMFSPDADCVRGQIVTFIYKAYY